METDDYFRALHPALIGTIAMIPAVVWVKYAPTRSLLLRLILEVAVGAFVYLPAVKFCCKGDAF